MSNPIILDNSKCSGSKGLRGNEFNLKDQEEISIDRNYAKSLLVSLSTSCNIQEKKDLLL